MAKTSPLSTITKQKCSDRVWGEGKKTALLFCQGDGGTTGSCLKDCAPSEGIRRWFCRLGVGDSAADKDRGGGRLALSFKAGVRGPRTGPGAPPPSSRSSSICGGFTSAERLKDIVTYIP